MRSWFSIKTIEAIVNFDNVVVRDMISNILVLAKTIDMIPH